MAERVSQKSLAGRQGILFGTGQVTQVRGGGFAQGCTVPHRKGLVGADTGLFEWTGTLPKTTQPNSLPVEPGWHFPFLWKSMWMTRQQVRPVSPSAVYTVQVVLLK